MSTMEYVPLYVCFAIVNQFIKQVRCAVLIHWVVMNHEVCSFQLVVK